MFTVATIQAEGGLHLVAVCSYCGDFVKAYRDAEGICILPPGWIRVGPHRDVGSVYGVTLYRSILMCLECLKILHVIGIEDAQFDLHCGAGECVSCTVHQLKGVVCDEKKSVQSGPWRRRFGL